MLLLLIGLWIKPFWGDYTPFTIVDGAYMPLWKVFSPLNKLVWLSTLASFVSAIIIALSITRFNSKYALLSRQSTLPGIIFVLLVSGISVNQGFHPGWITAILLIISVEYLFIAYNYRTTMKECFIAAFWISVASLFMFKVLFLIPLLLILMISMHAISFKSFLASIIGLIVPWLFVLGYELLFGSIINVVNYLTPTSEKIIGSYTHSVYSYVYIGGVFFLFLISMFSVINAYGTKKIYTRKQYQAFILLSLYISAIMAISSAYIELIPLIAIPFAIILSHLLDGIKSWIWQNVLFAVLLTLVVIGQIFL
jgi:hypothetical protein